MRLEMKETASFSCYTRGHRARCFGLDRETAACMELNKICNCIEGRVFLLSRRSKIGRFHFPVERS